MKKVVFAFVSVLGLLVAVWAGAGSGSENRESLFLVRFNPAHVIEPFYGPVNTCQWGQTREGGSDRRRSLDFQSDCAIKIGREQELMAAMRAEIMRSLEAARAHETSRQNDPDGGFRAKYRCGARTGTITLDPLEHTLRQHDPPLPPGFVDVRMTIRVVER